MILTRCAARVLSYLDYSAVQLSVHPHIASINDVELTYYILLANTVQYVRPTPHIYYKDPEVCCESEYQNIILCEPSYPRTVGNPNMDRTWNVYMDTQLVTR
jgi:hypothetical protein